MVSSILSSTGSAGDTVLLCHTTAVIPRSQPCAVTEGAATLSVLLLPLHKPKRHNAPPHADQSTYHTIPHKVRTHGDSPRHEMKAHTHHITQKPRSHTHMPGQRDGRAPKKAMSQTTEGCICIGTCSYLSKYTHTASSGMHTLQCTHSHTHPGSMHRTSTCTL